MPDMVVLVAQIQVVDTMLKIQFESTAVGGAIAGGLADVDFGLTAALTNQAIVDAAKAAQLATNAITIGPADKVMLFGGML